MAARSMMDSDLIRRAIIRLGHEIIERHGGTDGLVLVGIQRRGVVLAQRLADAIAESEQVRLPMSRACTASAAGTLPGPLVRLGRAVAEAATVPGDLSTDRRGRSLEARCNRTNRLTRHHRTRYFLSFR